MRKQKRMRKHYSRRSTNRENNRMVRAGELQRTPQKSEAFDVTD